MSENKEGIYGYAKECVNLRPPYMGLPLVYDILLKIQDGLKKLNLNKDFMNKVYKLLWGMDYQKPPETIDKTCAYCKKDLKDLQQFYNFNNRFYCIECWSELNK